MPLLKGQVQSPKFITAEITDSNNQIYYIPIRHTIGDWFLCQINDNYFAFTMKNARLLTHRPNKSGIGKSFQVIQYDTSHTHCLNPSTKELEIMLKENSLGKLDRKKHNILSILARREKQNFGMWSVGNEDFETQAEAESYLAGIPEEDRFVIKKDRNGKEIKKPLTVIHNVHNMSDLVKVFEGEEGEFPKQVREIKSYLNTLDIRQIVTPLRPLTEFITDDLITTHSGFLGEAIAQYSRLDGTLRGITNVPVKPKGNMTKYLIIGFIATIIVLGVYAGNESGAFKGITDFTDNLGTIQEGFKGIPAPGQFQQANKGGTDYSDAAIQAKYPDCGSIQVAINNGELNYNLLSSFMKGLVDAC